MPLAEGETSGGQDDPARGLPALQRRGVRGRSSGQVAARTARLRLRLRRRVARTRRPRGRRAIRVVVPGGGSRRRVAVLDGGRVTSGRNARRYPRTARLKELLRQIVADEIERIDDER